MDEPITTETNEAPQNFASFIGEDGSLNDGWKNTVPEEYRGEKCLDLINNTDSIWKNYIHAQKAFGKDKVVVPGETSPQEDVDAFQKAWGRPETSEDYSFKRDESIPEEVWDTDRIAKFKAGAYEAGFNSNQMAFVENFYNEILKTDIQTASAAQETAKAEAEAALKTEWGDAYDERNHLAQRVVNDTTEEGPARDALLDAVGNNPAVVKWVADLGMKLVETKAVDTTIHTQTPTEVNAEIADLQMTAGYMDGAMKASNPIGYKNLHEKITRLYEQANPE